MLRPICDRRSSMLSVLVVIVCPPSGFRRADRDRSSRGGQSEAGGRPGDSCEPHPHATAAVEEQELVTLAAGHLDRLQRREELALLIHDVRRAGHACGAHGLDGHHVARLLKSPKVAVAARPTGDLLAGVENNGGRGAVQRARSFYLLGLPRRALEAVQRDGGGWR